MAAESTSPDQPVESIEDLRRSFFYGSRSNLNVKFVRDLSDAEFGDFLVELFDASADLIDGGDPAAVVDAMFRWQVTAYAGHLGDPATFPYRKNDVPFTPLAKPLKESRILLLTSSGHFVDGDDPKPFGLENMSQAEAEARVGDFMKEPAVLSAIPIDTPLERIRVRHGGYPVEAAQQDHQVVLPLGHLRDLVEAGVIGGLTESAYSFVGATAQGHLRKTYGPQWAQLAKDQGADAALLVPI